MIGQLWRIKNDYQKIINQNNFFQPTKKKTKYINKIYTHLVSMVPDRPDRLKKKKNL